MKKIFSKKLIAGLASVAILGGLSTAEAAVGASNAPFVGITQQIGDLDTEVESVGSLAASLASLKPMTYDPSQPTSLMMGVSTYAGTQALAMGVSHHLNDNMAYHVGFAVAEKGKDKFMANVSLTWKFGRGVVKSANSEVEAEVEALQNKVVSMETTIAQLESKLKEVMARNKVLESQMKK